MLRQLCHGFVAAWFVVSCSAHKVAPEAAPQEGIRVLSWNISGDPLEREAHAFGALIRRAAPDILILDEVSPKLDLGQLRTLLDDLDGETSWHVSMGRSGGRQRTVIASKRPHRAVSGLSSEAPYPAADRAAIESGMTADDHENWEWELDLGIPLSGAIVDTGQRRLLVVGIDLQCCGDLPSSWQEMRRRFEADEIRRLIDAALADEPVDGIVIAGDLNLVGTVMPLIILTGPYGETQRQLSPAELYQLDGSTPWTWDGRGTKYASRPMDFQLYESRTLRLHQGFILDSQQLSNEELQALGIDADDAHRVSDHRPLLVEYTWVD